MSKTMIRLTMTLLAIAVLFTLAGVAEAGPLTPRTAPSFDKINLNETGSLLGQAWAWLAGFWTGSTAQTLEKNATEVPEPTSTTATCTRPEGCDAGYGLDPNG